jgi:NADPH:quinone reductase-like Zn-dependent oxidoreductase
MYEISPRFTLRVCLFSRILSLFFQQNRISTQLQRIANMSNLAAFVETEKGQIVVRDAEIPEPEEGEVLIKVYACGIQPADVKVAKYAMLAIEYPAVLGSPVAGIVEAVGPGVTKVSVGERVVCGTKVFVQKKPKYGGLQRFTLVDASETVEVTSSRSLD